MASKLLLALATGALVSCSVSRSSTCALAESPATYAGTLVELTDVIIVDGHGEPYLIPDPDCSAFAYFRIDDRMLDSETKDKFRNLIGALNTTTIRGERAGVAGNYKVRLSREIEPFNWSASLIEARALRVVTAASKSKSLKQQISSKGHAR
jgi:hypothetical protein